MTNSPVANEHTVHPELMAFGSDGQFFRVLFRLKQRGRITVDIPNEDFLDFRKLNQLLAKQGHPNPGFTADTARALQSRLHNYFGRHPELVRYYGGPQGWSDDELSFRYGPSNISSGFDIGTLEKVKDENGRPLSRGTLEEWNQKVVSNVRRGTRPLVALSFALAAPTLLFQERPRGGVGLHIFGASGTGKSASLQAAQSVTFGLASAWNGTPLGIAEHLMTFGDRPMILDGLEGAVSESETRAAFEHVAYALESGQPRLISKGARPAALEASRSTVISAAETAKHLNVKDGASARLIAVPVADETLPGVGAIDIWSGDAQPNAIASKHIVDNIKRHSEQFYGTALPTLILRLISTPRSQVEGQLEAYRTRFLQHVVRKLRIGGSTELRIAEAFSIAYSAARFAIGHRILQCDPRLLGHAFIRCLRDALIARGSVDRIVANAIDRVYEFCDANAVQLPCSSGPVTVAEFHRSKGLRVAARHSGSGDGWIAIPRDTFEGMMPTMEVHRRKALEKMVELGLLGTEGRDDSYTKRLQLSDGRTRAYFIRCPRPTPAVQENGTNRPPA